MKSSSADQTRESAGDSAGAFLTATDQTFPNITITSPRRTIRGSVSSRMVARHPIVRVRTPMLTVEASSSQATRAGMADLVKLVWQVSGKARIENASSSFEMRTGQAILLPMSRDYQLEMAADYDGLMLIFDPSQHAVGRDLVQQNIGRVIASDSAIAAGGAAIASLLDTAAGSPSDGFAIEAVINLVFRSIIANDATAFDLPERPSHRVRRARLMVEDNVTDHSYAPPDLARGLGVSRRTLYADFAAIGITPAAFIRQVRARCAHRDILLSRSAPISLTQIAIRNGYVDSSSFSRIFRETFGITPSMLKDNG